MASLRRRPLGAAAWALDRSIITAETTAWRRRLGSRPLHHHCGDGRLAPPPGLSTAPSSLRRRLLGAAAWALDRSIITAETAAWRRRRINVELAVGEECPAGARMPLGL